MELQSGSLYLTTRTISLFTTDVYVLDSPPYPDGAAKPKIKWSIKVAQDIGKIEGVMLPKLVSKMVPSGSLVMYIQTSLRTKNLKLVYEDFIGWTGLSDPPEAYLKEEEEDDDNPART